MVFFYFELYNEYLFPYNNIGNPSQMSEGSLTIMGNVVKDRPLKPPSESKFMSVSR